MFIFALLNVQIFGGEIKKEMSNIVKKDFIKYFKKQIGGQSLVEKLA